MGCGLLLGVSAFGLFLTSNLLLTQASAVIFGISLFMWLSPLSTLAMELPNMDPEKLAILNGVFEWVTSALFFFAPVITGALRITWARWSGIYFFRCNGMVTLDRGIHAAGNGAMSERLVDFRRKANTVALIMHCVISAPNNSGSVQGRINSNRERVLRETYENFIITFDFDFTTCGITQFCRSNLGFGCCKTFNRSRNGPRFHFSSDSRLRGH